jgi:DNA-binding NarL/FixJ family response regulator
MTPEVPHTQRDLLGDSLLRPVVIVDPLESLRRGLASELRSFQFTPVEPKDLISWFESTVDACVILTLLGSPELSSVSHLRERSGDGTILTLLPQPDLSAFCSALAVGASGAVSRDAPPDMIAETLDAAFRGQCVLPITIAQQMAMAPVAPRELSFGPREVGWLAALAAGASVADLARGTNYSQREMFRLLGRLYERLGARTKIEAILVARERGYI